MVSHWLRRGQWLDARHTCPLHIHDQLELVILIFGQLAVALGNGLAEADGVALSRQGGLEDQHLLELEALAYSGDVVDDRGRELFIAQPQAHKGMTVGEDKQRVEVCLFQAGCK